MEEAKGIKHGVTVRSLTSELPKTHQISILDAEMVCSRAFSVHMRKERKHLMIM